VLSPTRHIDNLQSWPEKTYDVIGCSSILIMIIKAGLDVSSKVALLWQGNAKLHDQNPSEITIGLKIIAAGKCTNRSSNKMCCTDQPQQKEMVSAAQDLPVELEGEKDADLTKLTSLHAI